MCKNYKSLVQEQEVRYIKGIVINILMKFGVRIGQVELDDLEQNCAKRWISAEHKYDSDRAKRTTLLSTVVKREIQDFLRKRTRERRDRARNIFLDKYIGDGSDTFSIMIPDFKSASDRQLLEVELKEKLSDAAQKLTRRQNEVYCLIKKLGKIDAEKFSRRLHISKCSVYERIRRMKKRLIREGLKEYSYKSTAFPYFWHRSKFINDLDIF